MSLMQFNKNNKSVYNISLISINIFLVVAVVIFIAYLFAPLLGGKMLFKALILYGSWIGLALLLRRFIKRIQKQIRINKCEYILLCLYNIICMFIWFSYPFNIFFGLLSILGIILGYKIYQRHED